LTLQPASAIAAIRWIASRLNRFVASKFLNDRLFRQQEINSAQSDMNIPLEHELWDQAVDPNPVYRQ